jgi:superfamily II helicase
MNRDEIIDEIIKQITETEYSKGYRAGYKAALISKTILISPTEKIKCHICKKTIKSGEYIAKITYGKRKKTIHSSCWSI